MPAHGHERHAAAQNADRAQMDSLLAREVPRRLQLLWALALAALVVFSSFWAYSRRCSMVAHRHQDWDHGRVRVTLYTPECLSVGEAGQVQITIINGSDRAATITATMEYSGTLPCPPTSDQSNVIRFGSLLGNEQITRRMTIQLPLCQDYYSSHGNWAEREFQLGVRLAVDDQPARLLGTSSLSVVPVPNTGWIGEVCQTLLIGLVTWTLKETWDWIKRAEPPSAGSGTGLGA